MLVKLTREQVSKHWPFVYKAIREALPPIADEEVNTKNNVLRSILSGNLEVWVYVEKGKNGSTIRAVVSTLIQEDEVVGLNNLLVYTMYSFGELSDEIWQEGLLTLLKYARGKDCSSLTFFTQNPKILEFFKRFGVDNSWRFISLPIKE